ncbi:MAG: OB-fold protein, partial [Mucilaginibacter sp.]
MRKKIITIALVFIATGAIGVWYYVFEYSKTHHRNVESEDATVITAALIVKDYEANEKTANASFLNKAVELKGVILKKAKDQAGNTTVTLKSGDPFANIFCTLKP